MSDIDIVVTFNEVDFKNRSIGFLSKKINGHGLTYTDQIVALKKSIDLNWVGFKGRVLALHSEPLDDEYKKKLNKAAIEVMCVETDHDYDRVHNRSTAYLDLGLTSTHTLVMDADMLVLKTPKFDLTKDILGGYGDNLGISLENWRELFYHANIPLPQINMNAYKDYQEKGEKSFFPMINNGLILIRNSYKEIFLDNMLNMERYIFGSELYKNEKVRHFFCQLAVSVSFYMGDNIDYFERGINFLGERLSAKKYEPSIYHYVGQENKELDTMYYSYF
jgi:hypothetical protein